mmetsp:Transcript_7732/g.21131  ORF Transcript_7732/g.21131 Transcript_7732/m.21131 type:complete len:197 (-) Transcript_7732:209-799(-)
MGFERTRGRASVWARPSWPAQQWQSVSTASHFFRPLRNVGARATLQRPRSGQQRKKPIQSLPDPVAFGMQPDTGCSGEVFNLSKKSTAQTPKCVNRNLASMHRGPIHAPWAGVVSTMSPMCRTSSVSFLTAQLLQISKMVLWWPRVEQKPFSFGYCGVTMLLNALSAFQKDLRQKGLEPGRGCNSHCHDTGKTSPV